MHTPQIYSNFEGQLEELGTDKANFLSTLFSFILARPPIYAPDLSDLIDALDEIQPDNRALLLANFENDGVDSRILVDSIWVGESGLEKPNWTRCLQVYDKLIERTIAWGYPHIAATVARRKAIIHNEYLHDPDTAYKVLQDMETTVGVSSVIEEGRAAVCFYHKYYKEALDIYERILPEWPPTAKKFGLVPSIGCRQAAICAAHLGDWEKAAIFFEDGAKRAKENYGTEQYIGLYADAGFAQFKAGNVLDSINLLSMALKKFDMLPQDDTDVGYFTLKKLLGYSMNWLAQQNKKNNIKSVEPPPGFCSDPARDNEIMNYPNFPIQYAWLHLAQMEYQFNLGMTIFEQALQIKDRNAYPALRFSLSFLKLQHDFRNKTFDELPQRMCQLADARVATQKHEQSKKEIGEKGFYVPLRYLTSSVENIIGLLAAALLVQLSTNRDTAEILAIWRTKISKLLIKENMIIALDLIESILVADVTHGLPNVVYSKDIVSHRCVVESVSLKNYSGRSKYGQKSFRIV